MLLHRAVEGRPRSGLSRRAARGPRVALEQIELDLPATPARVRELESARTSTAIGAVLDDALAKAGVTGRSGGPRVRDPAAARSFAGGCGAPSSRRGFGADKLEGLRRS